MTTSSRRPSPASRATRRSRRPAPRSTTFLERNRSRLLWLIGALVLGLLIFVGFVLPAATPAYACANTFAPTPAPSWVAPSPAPVASGATPAPAVTPPPPGYVEPDMGRGHVTTGAKINYTWCPPASGKHYAELPFGPIKGGLYGPDEATIPQGWLHNLEHGGIVLLYSCTADPDACTEPGQRALEELVARWPDSPICKFEPGTLTPVIARFDNMPYAYAGVVWDVVLPMATLDEESLFAFYAAQGERFNPEKQCADPTAVPVPTPTAGPTGTSVPTTAPTAAPSAVPTGTAPAASTAASPS